MSDEAKSSAERVRADLEGAAWIIRHDRGLTAAEQDDFLQWLAADPSHQEWFARHRQTWTQFNLLEQWRPEHSRDPNPDLLARQHRGHRSAWIWTGALAAAASLCVMVLYWPSHAGKHRSTFPAEIVAAAYEQRVLEDGSTVDLNGGAHLVVKFTPNERRVTLARGEAQFTVTKNPDRPFVVRAGGIDVRAVGTAFNVRLDEGTVEVLVTEGQVQLDRPPGATKATDSSSPAPEKTTNTGSVPWRPSLVAGQRMIVPRAMDLPMPPVLTVSAEDTRRLLAWRPQLLDFNSTPLAEVIAVFNRHNTVQLSIADDVLRNLPIVASFRSDNLDGFVRLLEITAQVQAERRGDDLIVLRKAGATQPR